MSPFVSRSDWKKAVYELHGLASQCQEEWRIAHRTQEVGGYKGKVLVYHKLLENTSFTFKKGKTKYKYFNMCYFIVHRNIT